MSAHVVQGPFVNERQLVRRDANDWTGVLIQFAYFIVKITFAATSVCEVVN